MPPRPASARMNDKQDHNAVRHNLEPAKRCLNRHGKPDRDAKRRYEEPAKHCIARWSASQVSACGGVRVDAPKKERRVRWCITLLVRAIRPWPPLTCLHTQCTASAQSPARRTAAASLCCRCVPITSLRAHESHARCLIVLRPPRPYHQLLRARQRCPSERRPPRARRTTPPARGSCSA